MWLIETNTLAYYLLAKLELTQGNLFTGLHSKGRLRALPVNIILECKCLNMTNTSAYFDAELLTAVESVIVRAPGVVLCFKLLQLPSENTLAYFDPSVNLLN